MKSTLVANCRRIAYYTSGRQKNSLPALLLHGFCEDASVWDTLLPYLPEQQVIRMDLPGFGDSEMPLSPGMDCYAAAVCAVLNELNIKRCVLFGHSMGGYTALAFARNYPERLAGFSLVHSHPYSDSAAQIANRQRGIEMLQAGKKDLYVAQLFPNLFTAPFAMQNPERLQQLIRTGQQLSVEGIMAGLQGMLERTDQLETLKCSLCPVQFILGDQDTLNPLDRALAAAAQPNIADIRVFPGVAHMGMFEATEKTGTAMRDFWQFCNDLFLKS